MQKYKFSVTGMTCAACSSHVEKAVSSLPGVSDISVSLLTDTLTLTLAGDDISTDDIIKAVKNAGYGAAIFAEKSSAVRSDMATSNEPLQKLILSVMFTLPLLYLSMSGMLRLPIPYFFNGGENCLVLALTEAILSAIVIFINFRYFKVGFSTLFRFSPTMDSLVAIGSAASYLYGLAKLFIACKAAGSGDLVTAKEVLSDLYFESSAMILTLISLGKYFELKSRRKTGVALQRLISLSPTTALLIKDNDTVEIPADSIKVGDRLVLRPGMKSPVDGRIVSGAGAFDEQAVTGESIPVDKTVGDRIVSATTLQNGSVVFEATEVGENTTINKIIKTVEEAGASKAPIARIADRIAAFFVPAVILISVVCTFVWLLFGASLDFALNMGVSVLVISCPCSLGLATPVSVMVASGKGAELGILYKSAESLEIAGKINSVALDKTGTITAGTPVVTDVVPQGVSTAELLSAAFSLEYNSEHPLAKAVCNYASEHGAKHIESTEYTSVFGKGAVGRIGDSVVLAGNKKLMFEHQIDTSALDNISAELSSSGKTVLYFAIDKRFLGLIAVSDVPRESSRSAVSAFNSMGISVSMLTGDNPLTAEAIADSVGIKSCYAGILPTEKSEIVTELKRKGNTVAMIGDGINDAPALAGADLGIAIGNGSEIAIDSADIVLLKNDLRSAVTTIRLSRRTLSNIKENLFWALIYNSVGIPIAAGVLYPAFGIGLSPMIAAAAMSISSICVVSNALRLRRFRDDDKKASRTYAKTVYIDGMMCEHCVAHVKEALTPFGEVTVNLAKGIAIIKTDTDDSVIRQVITDAGYEVTDIK